MFPLFSVLIANYNNGKYISECLDSVLKQDYPNIEIVIVDDGSTDHSLEIINRYCKAHQNIKLFRNIENKGVGYTKKQCIDCSNGEILGYVDPDDSLAKNAVSCMMIKHQQNEQAVLFYSNHYKCDENLNINIECYSAQVSNGLIDFFNDEGKISHFATFKKSAYLKTKGLNVSLNRAVDQDLYLKLYDVGECIHIPQLLYYYRIHKDGLSTKAQTDLAYYWFWMVKMLRAQEKGLNLEKDFTNTFVRAASLKYWIKIDKLFRRSPLYKLFSAFK